MARPIEFNRKDKLNLAMELFWQKGYQATSMKDLSETLGLRPGSIYSAFKNKKSLFLEALEVYFQERMDVFTKLFENSHSTNEVFKRILMDLMGDVLGDKKGRGCLMINTLLEMKAHDEQLSTRVSEMFLSIEDLFCQGFKVAQNAGEMAKSRDPRILAKLMLINIQGIRVYSNLNPDPASLECIIQQIFSSFDLKGILPSKK